MISLSELYRNVRNTSVVRGLTQCRTKSITVTGAAGSLERMVVGAIWEASPSQLIYIVNSGEQRRQAYEDLAELIGIANLAEYRGPEQGGRYQEDKELIRIVEQTDTLRALNAGWRGILVMTPESLLQQVSRPDRLEASTARLRQGEEIKLHLLESGLKSKGFEEKPFIEVPGDYAIRGGIFDIYPFAGKHPLRLEFWGDQIESIREFDELTQRSIREITQAVLLPNLNQHQNQAVSTEDGSLIEHLQQDCRVILGRGVQLKDVLFQKYEHLKSNRARRHENYRLVSPTKVLDDLKPFHQVAFVSDEEASTETIDLGGETQPSFHGNIEMFAEVMGIARAQGMTCYVLCEGEAQIRRIHELLEGKGQYEVVPDALHSGFVFPAGKQLVFTEHQLFDRYRRREVEGQRHIRRGMSLRELRDLKPGDYVVHTDHGIGKFVGLEKIKVRGAEQESLKVIYDEHDVLYVNINKLNRIQKYSSEEGHTPRLNRLGSDAWERSKARTKSKIKDIARELIRLYARRKLEPGFSFGADTHWQTELEASFMYEDTPDQASATLAVKADMENPHPMDRLVCGDVGFGKTEVAIRAAFKAVMGGKQVAVLVPTTVLAQQHFETFSKRLGRFPVKVEMVSRFRSAGQIKQILQQTAAGEVDILIGTHRLISKDVSFKDLGLLVIDEEQRFGVTTKEKLKELRASVDTLTLTATPIPRTLHLSLMGARDLSIIATPPRNRQPVQTELHAFGPEVIREAIEYELGRKGQVFLVHNRVRSIESMADYIRKLIPKARVRVAHGQMNGPQLEQVMVDFGEHKFDVLVSSAIIENGLDVPNANTMIVNRADRFGLAQLYQLRGRVGRSNQRAFCYLLTPPFESLPKDSIRRLEAIEEFTDLGSGFNVAMRDLDIRGAGNLLGSAQSGYIETVGFEMYQRLITEAVAELKLEEFSDVFTTPEGPMQREEELPDTQVEVDADAYLPEHYVENSMERLQLYRRLNEITEPKQLQEIAGELRDRFGRLPVEANHLLMSIRLRLTAQQGGFTRVDLVKHRLTVQFPGRERQQFYEGGRFDEIMAAVIRSAGQYKLIESGKSLRLEMPVAGGDDPQERMNGAIRALEKLGATA